jgi:hypothetical protein
MNNKLKGIWKDALFCLILDIPTFFWKRMSKVVPVRAITQYGEVEVQLHSFLTLVLAGTLCNVTQHINICIILKFGTRWLSLVDVTCTPALLPRIEFPVLINSRLGGPESRSVRIGREINLLFLTGIEPRFLGHLSLCYGDLDRLRKITKFIKSNQRSSRPIIEYGLPDWETLRTAATPRLYCSTWSLT